MTDHRAEAEACIERASMAPGDERQALPWLARALVHATLAVGTPVADQHVVSEALVIARQNQNRILRELSELRDAAEGGPS